MTTVSDSGTQPNPHYCTQRLTDDGTITGCPDWPACLFPNAAGPIPAEPPHVDDAPVRGLVSAAGWAAGVVLLLAVLWAVLA